MVTLIFAAEKALVILLSLIRNFIKNQIDDVQQNVTTQNVITNFLMQIFDEKFGKVSKVFLLPKCEITFSEN